MSYTQITLREFDNFCKREKGWIRNRSGYEYVYDYRVPNTPIVIKILSSIDVDGGICRNRGADAIRIFAVLVDANNKVKKGLVKAERVNRCHGWEDRVIKAFKSIREQAKKAIQQV